MADHVPGEGSFEVQLHGEARPLELKCSVGACLTLCRQPGGIGSDIDSPNLSTVTTRLMALDLDTMALLIRLGLSIGINAVPGLEEQIYKTGLYAVRLQLAPFLGALKNGGVPFKDAAAGADEEAKAADVDPLKP